MKLFVDDTRPAPAGWNREDSITHVITLLHRSRVEEISLDYHRLCYCHQRDPHEINETYEGIAYYLLVCPWPPRRVNIHCGHDANALRLINILQDAAAWRFPTFMPQITRIHAERLR